MKIGVLALQGDFAEHQTTLQQLGINSIQVRLPRDLDGLNGLIIPGGESTTIGPASLVMRGDQVPANTVWQGNPIEPWTNLSF